MSRWPRLVQPQLCTTRAELTLTGGESADGTPQVALELTRYCRLEWEPARAVSPNRDFGDGSRRSINAERLVEQGGGIAWFDGDIAPQQTVLAGWVTAMGRQWRIRSGIRACNPDGTVNYTRLVLE